MINLNFFESMNCARGSCQCKKVSFEVSLPISWDGHCHCTQCQKIHGAAFVTWVGFKTDNFKILDPENKFRTYNSGIADRGFCSNCGSSFYFKYNSNITPQMDWKGFVYFTRTNITTELNHAPAQHIYYGSHVKWFHFSDNVPKM